jgi:hypothetical protein
MLRVFKWVFIAFIASQVFFTLIWVLTLPPK